MIGTIVTLDEQARSQIVNRLSIGPGSDEYVSSGPLIYRRVVIG